MGVPMRPEQIQDLMRAMNVPKVAQTNPEESNSGDGDAGNCDSRPQDQTGEGEKGRVILFSKKQNSSPTPHLLFDLCGRTASVLGA